jgi:DNA processing protein
VAGDPQILRHGARVAIVGSRKASAQRLARARKQAKRLCERAIVVVSGLAAGIDTAAHQATLAAGGRTIAVLVHNQETFFGMTRCSAHSQP